jgi:hypothetical protein
MEKLSYASESSTSPWTTYLRQIDRVAPYLGDLAYVKIDIRMVANTTFTRSTR